MSARWIRRAAAAAILLTVATVAVADARAQPSRESVQATARQEMAQTAAAYAQEWRAGIGRTCRGRIIDERTPGHELSILKPRLRVADCVARNLALIEPIAAILHPHAGDPEPSAEALADQSRMRLCIDAAHVNDRLSARPLTGATVEAFPLMLMECLNTLRLFMPRIGVIPTPPVIKLVAPAGPNPAREQFVSEMAARHLKETDTSMTILCSPLSKIWISDDGRIDPDDLLAQQDSCHSGNVAAAFSVAIFISWTQHWPEGINVRHEYFGLELVDMCHRRIASVYRVPTIVLPCIVTLDRFFESAHP